MQSVQLEHFKGRSQRQSFQHGKLDKAEETEVNNVLTHSWDMTDSLGNIL